jgi:CheY-like chemotaxis protein
MNAERISVPLRAAATVLVADDEVLVRFLIAEHFRNEGCRVIEATNGEEALSILRTVQPVDLVISDISMPGSIDGITLARHVKQDYQLPVILVSGHYPGALVTGVADAFFAKPYQIEQIAVAAAKLLKGTEP